MEEEPGLHRNTFPIGQRAACANVFTVLGCMAPQQRALAQSQEAAPVLQAQPWVLSQGLEALHQEHPRVAQLAARGVGRPDIHMAPMRGVGLQPPDHKLTAMRELYKN